MTAAAALLMAACSSAQDSTTEDAAETGPAETSPTVTAEAEPTDTQRDEVILTVTFDGDACTYEGPTELSPGAVSIEIVNNSDRTTVVDVARFVDDVTWDDFVAHHQPEPKVAGRPDHLATFEVGQALAWRGDHGSISSVMEEGEYALVCLQDRGGGNMAWVARPGGVIVTAEEPP